MLGQPQAILKVGKIDDAYRIFRVTDYFGTTFDIGSTFAIIGLKKTFVQEYVEFHKAESLDDIICLPIHVLLVVTFFPVVIVILDIPFNRYGDIRDTGTENGR